MPDVPPRDRTGSGPAGAAADRPTGRPGARPDPGPPRGRAARPSLGGGTVREVPPRAPSHGRAFALMTSAYQRALAFGMRRWVA
ncbi:hypothetical protein GCM10023082_19140 [Streptomyces tremellae]|uniref:Uncharacterized protein n=1 Tax=Streptomyces tremellae TaxID=1124239 RepID=A0ABP7EPA4_9ACTN